MRHATSWRKNQSEVDAFDKPFETSNTINIVDTVFFYFFFILLLFFFFLFANKTKYFETLQNSHSKQSIVDNMQQISNDTGSWNLILVPPPSSLLYNSNTHDIPADNNPTIHHFDNPILSLSSLVNHESTSEQANTVNYWAFILIIFPLFTIFGNILVVISVYREKSLHTITNYFVVSLAISDITVAAVVMPFAIYLEYNRVWRLSERLCDFWVASDCMACTASILNLVAIAIDRYIAVTKPLKYARHKNPKRVAIMIVVVWLISFFIALPIVSGVNKSDVPDYPRDPQQCAFFNNKFLIFSSLGSFFIPCIIIFAIYYRIFMVIMAQARKNRKQWRPKTIIESAALQHRTNADTLITSYYNERQSIVGPVSVGPEQTSLTFPNDINDNTQIRILDTQRNSLMLKLTTPVLPTVCFQANQPLSSSNDQINDDESPDDIVQPNHQQQANGDKQIEILVMNRTKNCSSQTDDQVSSKRMKTRLKLKNKSDGSAVTAAVKTTANNVKIAKRKAYSRMKKERKATQTLIIVLICFLVCWLPFFVLNNIVNAIVKLLHKSDKFLIKDSILALCVWLGYINSFLNPIIYTIFNMEFRKAFAKILFSSCQRLP